MKNKNLKQIELLRAAEEKGLKIGKSHISQYVSGKTIPRDNILNVLADILEVDAGWLKGNENSNAILRSEIEPQKNIIIENTSDLYNKKQNKLEETSMKEFR